MYKVKFKNNINDSWTHTEWSELEYTQKLKDVNYAIIKHPNGKKIVKDRDGRLKNRS